MLNTAKCNSDLLRFGMKWAASNSMLKYKFLCGRKKKELGEDVDVAARLQAHANY